VLPKLMPKICVCAAPLKPVTQMSELMLVTLGAMALGGGLTTVVLLSLVLEVLLSLVD
jgi:hypothetical protein